MAWLATNKNGTETISPQRPERGWGGEWDFSDEVFVEGEYGEASFTLELPSGSIEKLIGRVLTWEDEPIEIK